MCADCSIICFVRNCFIAALCWACENMGQQGMEFVCAVKNCEYRNAGLYVKFPNPEKREKLFMKWVESTGDSSLLEHHPLDIYYSMRICERHFDEEDFEERSETEMPIPYLNVPDPINVPKTWITTVKDTMDIDDHNPPVPTTYRESDVIETSGFMKYSYTTCDSKNWFLYRNMFMIAENISDDDEDNSCLWSASRDGSAGEPDDNKPCFSGNIKNIKKCVHYIVTSPAEYYSLKFKSLLRMHRQLLEQCEELRAKNRKLNRKMREMKSLLYMQHV